MPNFNTTSGTAFGVISARTLTGDVLDTLFYGSGAVNLSEKAVSDEARKAAEWEWFFLVTNATENVIEKTGIRNGDQFDDDFEVEIEKLTPNQITDRDEFIEFRLDEMNNNLEIDEPVIEGVYEDVHYCINWLGGAIIVFVTESPFKTHAAACSPCVPGAGDLDNLHAEGVECYDVPTDWRYDFKEAA